MCKLIRVGKELKRDFIPAYKACFFGRHRVSPLKTSKIMNRVGGHSHVGCLVRTSWVIMIIGMGFGIIIGILAIFFHGILLLPIFLMLLIPILFYQSDNYLLGYLGERAVASELEKLGRHQWRIFHDLETSYGNIDHIIVCSKGVFYVETKTRRKSTKANETLVLRNDKIFIEQDHSLSKVVEYPLPHDPIKSAKENAKRLYNYINYKCYKSSSKKMGFVVPIIIFPGWTIEDSSLNGNTVLCNNEQIPDVFKNRKDKLSEDEFNNICKLLEGKNQIDLSDVS